LVYIYIFFNAIPVFCHTAFTVPFGRPFFNSFSLYLLPILASGGVTGLRGTFPDHPRSFHLTFTDIHNIYTPMAPFPTGLEPVLTSRWWSKRKSVDSSFHHPTVSPEETHTSMPGGGSFLGKNSNSLASGPLPRSTFSDSHAATELTVTYL
jgi:hypothetical protein